MSHLVFDGDENSLSLFDGHGKLVGAWPASNRGGGTENGLAFITHIPDGDYEFEPHSQYRPQRHQDPNLDTLNGPYGTLGILRLKDILVHGHWRKGLGVHAGRVSHFDAQVISRHPWQAVHHRGPYHRTHGCIRTTEQAMHTITAAISKDPLKHLKIRNNGR